jgi:hypothetical protein
MDDIFARLSADDPTLTKVVWVSLASAVEQEATLGGLRIRDWPQLLASGVTQASQQLLGRLGLASPESDAQMAQLVEALGGNTHARTICLADPTLTDTQLEPLAAALAGCNVVEVQPFAGDTTASQFSDGLLGMVYRTCFANALDRVRTDDPTITSLSLSHLGLSDSDLEQVADALSVNAHVTELLLVADGQFEMEMQSPTRVGDAFCPRFADQSPASARSYMWTF